MHVAAHAHLAAPTAFPSAAAVCWSEMVSHRGYLVRFAQRKLHDPMLAEDVVHDVFEAVISGRASFGGRAALRSWLTATTAWTRSGWTTMARRSARRRSNARRPGRTK